MKRGMKQGRWQDRGGCEACADRKLGQQTDIVSGQKYSFVQAPFPTTPRRVTGYDSLFNRTILIFKFQKSNSLFKTMSVTY